MANNIFVLDDGTREITIKNNYGDEICKLHIRTGEIGILDRYNEMAANIGELVKPLSKISMKADGTTQFEKDWETVKGVEHEIIKAIDGLFDMHDADKLFATRHAFSSVDGVFYCEKVLDLLGEIVRSSIEEASQKALERTSKYTSDIKEEETKDVDEK